MRTRFIALLACAIGFSQGSFSQDLDAEKLDRYLETLAQNNKFMGSVALSRNGQVIYQKSVGFRVVEEQLRADENSKYRIGSISKTFTTVLIFKAVEAKKLQLDETIDKWFPTIPNAKKITVGQLLQHRSGIHNFTNDPEYLNWNTEPQSRDQQVERIARGGSDFKPDSKAEYSNSNFVLLTYILEDQFGEPYSTLIERYITQPAGLKNTAVGKRIDPNSDECYSYSFNGEWQREAETDMSVPVGAGAIISTPTDLTRFSQALFTGKLLSAKSLEKMQSVRDGYGMGLFQMPFDSRKGFGHTGSIDGFNSIFSYFLSDSLSFAILSNGLNYDLNTIAINVLNAAFGKAYEIPDFRKVEVSEKLLKQYSGVYSSESFPLKITISHEAGTLIAQATGQSAFPLEATDDHTFRFDRAGIVLTFDKKSESMTLEQNGMTFTLEKE